MPSANSTMPPWPSLVKVMPSGPVTLMKTSLSPGSAILFSATEKLILNPFTRLALMVVVSLPVRNCFLMGSTLISEVLKRAAKFFSRLPSKLNLVFSPYKPWFTDNKLSLLSRKRAFSSFNATNWEFKSSNLLFKASIISWLAYFSFFNKYVKRAISLLLRAISSDICTLFAAIAAESSRYWANNASAAAMVASFSFTEFWRLVFSWLKTLRSFLPICHI